MPRLLVRGRPDGSDPAPVHPPDATPQARSGEVAAGGVDWVAIRTARVDRRKDRIMGLLDDAKNAANSDKGEKATDAGIDKAEQAASDKTGGQHDDKIEQAGNAADGRIGS
ncbi:hypothetical protein ASF89_00535 [Frigoribacterium sp. Leaf172]|nr:hypothetical protein ASF89_00535 [Frigoribacterium sp. Leaf172]